MLSIIIFIITLLLLVVIHELGHFLVAKKFGIKVLEFGFGIPPRIWGKKWGETLVSINWLPFGGFVRLLGEDETDAKMLKNERSFASQNVWKRFAVVIAGVFMNLLLAWALFYIVIFASNFKVVLPTSEEIVAISEVAPSSPAEQSGLKKGDRIVALNDTLINDSGTFLETIKANLGKEVALGVSDWQGRNIRIVKLTPRLNPPPGQGAIGVVTSPVAFKEFNTPLEKILAGPIYSYELMQVIIPGTINLFKEVLSGQFGKASEQVAGPVRIAQVSGTILNHGWDSVLPYLWFSALLSLNLAMINILPFPGLDGGRAFFIAIEGFTKKKVNPVVEKYIHSAGLVFLLGLITLITISDVRKLFS